MKARNAKIQEDWLALKAAVEARCVLPHPRVQPTRARVAPTSVRLMCPPGLLRVGWAALGRGVAVQNLVKGARAQGALAAEAEWIKERLAEASSTDYGKDLATTEQLLKAHAALAVAMGMHEEPINNAIKDARNSGNVRRKDGSPRPLRIDCTRS